MVIFAELTQNRKPISGAHVAANVYVADARGYSTLNQQIILTDQALPGYIPTSNGRIKVARNDMLVFDPHK